MEKIHSESGEVLIKISPLYTYSVKLYVKLRNKGISTGGSISYKNKILRRGL